MRLRLIFAVLILPLLAACNNVYHPLKGGVGFLEVPTGADTFQISYIGDASVSVAEARRFALLRAAELAALRNTAYFQIVGEQIYVAYGSQYWPGTYTRFYGGGRRGYGGGYVYGMYEPGYVETYTVPDVEMQVRLTNDGAAPSIPAGYLLWQAMGEKIELSPGVAERVGALPEGSGPVVLPAAPAPMTMPAGGA